MEDRLGWALARQCWNLFSHFEMTRWESPRLDLLRTNVAQAIGIFIPPFGCMYAPCGNRGTCCDSSFLSIYSLALNFVTNNRNVHEGRKLPQFNTPVSVVQRVVRRAYQLEEVLCRARAAGQSVKAQD